MSGIMYSLLGLAVMLGLSAARDQSAYSYVSESKYSLGRFYYGGIYVDKCGLDGLYYKDVYSFVICSNGNSYIQPCAPGTQNSDNTKYVPGSYYAYSHFCDVNLNDYATFAHPHGYGYESPVVSLGYNQPPRDDSRPYVNFGYYGDRAPVERYHDNKEYEVGEYHEDVKPHSRESGYETTYHKEETKQHYSGSEQHVDKARPKYNRFPRKPIGGKLRARTEQSYSKVEKSVKKENEY